MSNSHNSENSKDYQNENQEMSIKNNSEKSIDIQKITEKESSKRFNNWFGLIFSIALLLSISGTLFTALFNKLGFYIDYARYDEYYEHRNPIKSRHVIYPKVKHDSNINKYNHLDNRQILRLRPFSSLSLYNYYTGNYKGLQINVYDMPSELNDLHEAFVSSLCYLFENVEGYPSNCFKGEESLDDMVLGNHPAFTYCFIDEDGYYNLASVFSTNTKWDNKLCVVISSGASFEEAQTQRDSFLSHFEIYDFNKCTHISIVTLEVINSFGIITVCMLILLYVAISFRNIKSKVLNKKAKYTVYLNSVYVAGWTIFAVISVNSFGIEYDRETWAATIAFTIISMLILRNLISKCDKPYSEFYLIPKFLKTWLTKQNLNTQFVYRLILLLIIWPLYYLALVPIFGWIAMIYVACMCFIFAFFLTIISIFKWISKGKGKKVD